jgi:ABC-type microcin C transport system duplicated ATPase subunit YejF
MSTRRKAQARRGTPAGSRAPLPDDSPVMASDDALLRVEGLVKHFPIKAGVFKHTVGAVRAVDGVDISVAERRDPRHRRRVRAAARRPSAGRSSS